MWIGRRSSLDSERNKSIEAMALVSIIAICCVLVCVRTTGLRSVSQRPNLNHFCTQFFLLLSFASDGSVPTFVSSFFFILAKMDNLNWYFIAPAASIFSPLFSPAIGFYHFSFLLKHPYDDEWWYKCRSLLFFLSLRLCCRRATRWESAQHPEKVIRLCIIWDATLWPNDGRQSTDRTPQTGTIYFWCLFYAKTMSK